MPVSPTARRRTTGNGAFAGLGRALTGHFQGVLESSLICGLSRPRGRKVLVIPRSMKAASAALGCLIVLQGCVASQCSQYQQQLSSTVPPGAGPNRSVAVAFGLHDGPQPE